MSRSQLVAIAVALEELGRDVEVTPNGAEVALVVPGSPADGELQVGDLIVEANGEEIQTTDELQAGLRRRRAGRQRRAHGRARGGRRGDQVELTVPTQRGRGRRRTARSWASRSRTRRTSSSPSTSRSTRAGSAGRRPGWPSRSTSSTSSATRTSTAAGRSSSPASSGSTGPCSRSAASSRRRSAHGRRRRHLPRPRRQLRGGQGRGRRPSGRPGLDVRRSVGRAGDELVFRLVNTPSGTLRKFRVFRWRQRLTRRGRGHKMVDPWRWRSGGKSPAKTAIFARRRCAPWRTGPCPTFRSAKTARLEPPAQARLVARPQDRAHAAA